MRIIKVSYQKPANLLIAAIQQYCKTLLADAMENNVANLKDLEDKVWQYGQSMQNAFSRCAFDKLDVISHQNVVHQFHNLIYNDTKPMITISARPEEFEAAFRDYDLANQHL